ncbi:zinc finger SWIM domain-containing protein 7 isoform X1 [Hippopotamus amphibius kiboko]|uniref:zinc finger SWIM domain-containing protein 7 isoform X1 n=1 Tax=Hippopotamus amphibius kiboko TaxID=575201 RepID=UPI002597D33B|nr:zinc finger SWIM domain-containing protein 7 isoform X1 [Hippopotamus amphibius kiboko]
MFPRTAPSRPSHQPPRICAPLPSCRVNGQIWACGALRRSSQAAESSQLQGSALRVPPALKCLAKALTRFLPKTCLSASVLSLYRFSDPLQVLGSSGKTYTCLASCHYCSCPAFAFSVLRKSDSLLCKHLLAVYLSQVTRTCQQLAVSDKQLTDVLLMEKIQEA